MRKKAAPTNQHERTRADHATELAEDYVEAVAEIIDREGVCRIKNLADRFQVSHVTASRTVARLQRAGLASTAPHAPVELTNRGRQLAAESKRKHETVYQFLIALGVSEATAASDTEGIEHHVSLETLGLMEKFIQDQQP
ncbi:iron dependent repressor, metal binding and dimerization domain protein [Planctomycetaceae bacterium SH139]